MFYGVPVVFRVSASQWSAWAVAPTKQDRELMIPYIWSIGISANWPHKNDPQMWEATLWEDRELVSFEESRRRP